jgi:dUTP pyrophosphatase
VEEHQKVSSTLATLKPNFPPTKKNVTKSDKPKIKKFYSTGEQIWIKPLKRYGELISLNTETKDVVVGYYEDEHNLHNFTKTTFKVWQIDKARTLKKTKTPPKSDNNTLLFAKIKPNATIPSKRDEDGCYDVYACFDEDQIVIYPGQTVLIPTGIASSFSSKFRISLRERGSTGTKCMSIRAGQIDSGYRGEWFVPVNNTGINNIIIAKNAESWKISNPTSVVYPYDKAIGQAALEIVPVVDIKEVSYDELQAIPSERGTGKIGSSNK